MFKSYSVLGSTVYFLGSSQVHVFPCASRGQDDDGNPFDPEARLNTERNFSESNLVISNASGITDLSPVSLAALINTMTYPTSDLTMTLNVHGYLMTLVIPKDDVISFRYIINGSASKTLYINGYVRPSPIIGNYMSNSLASWYATDGVLDHKIDGNYYFTGVCLSCVPIDSLSSIPSFSGVLVKKNSTDESFYEPNSTSKPVEVSQVSTGETTTLATDFTTTNLTATTSSLGAATASSYTTPGDVTATGTVSGTIIKTKNDKVYTTPNGDLYAQKFYGSGLASTNSAVNSYNNVWTTSGSYHRIKYEGVNEFIHNESIDFKDDMDMWITNNVTNEDCLQAFKYFYVYVNHGTYPVAGFGRRSLLSDSIVEFMPAIINGSDDNPANILVALGLCDTHSMLHAHIYKQVSNGYDANYTGIVVSLEEYKLMSPTEHQASDCFRFQKVHRGTFFQHVSGIFAETPLTVKLDHIELLRYYNTANDNFIDCTYTCYK